MEQGFDPEVKKYFRKIIYSFSWGFLWMLANATAGIYFGLGYRDGKPLIVPILFYTASVISLCLLLWYYYRTWSK